MKLTEVALKEELEIRTKNEAVNELFINILPEVFSPSYLKKLNRVFKDPIVASEFGDNSTVVAYTQNGKIYVNAKQFYSMDPERAIIYVLHEMFHMLQKMQQFKGLKYVNSQLMSCAMKYLHRWEYSKFLTGKTQNLHSDYKEEFLTYLMNNSEQIKMLPKEGRLYYYEILKESGCFNLSSAFWRKRLADCK